MSRAFANLVYYNKYEDKFHLEWETIFERPKRMSKEVHVLETYVE